MSNPQLSGDEVAQLGRGIYDSRFERLRQRQIRVREAHRRKAVEK